MTILPKCPSCGLESAEIRCPRCNTLKLIGCEGSCATCASRCPSGVECPPSERAPSEGADNGGGEGFGHAS
jgi:hypothetical protein